MSMRLAAVEPTSPSHVVGGFDCGSLAQTEWLTRHAMQSHRAGLSRVYVVRGLDEPDGRVVGYYALAAGSVAQADASPRMRHGVGRYHQPVVILTRLHCESEAARDFYLRLAKFEVSPTDPMHLMLLMKDLRRALSS